MLRKRIVAAATASILALGMSMGGAGVAMANNGDPSVVNVTNAGSGGNPGQVWVCKYVGKPGEDERLSHIIGPNGNAVPGWDRVTLNVPFADGQNRSIVIQIGGGEPALSACPAGEGAPEEPPAPTVIEPLALTFIQDCDPEVHVWRVHNPNAFPVQASWRTSDNSASGTVTAHANGDTFFEGVKGTKILSWGGGESGIAAGQTHPREGGNDQNVPTATFQYIWNGSNGFTVNVTREGCSPGQTLNVSSYTLDKSADNNSTTFGASNPNSYPQTLFAHGEDIVLPPSNVKLYTDWTASRTVPIPDCGDYQADLYSGNKLDVVGVEGHDVPGSKFLAGGIVLQEECATLNTAPFVEQATCVVDDNGNFTGEVAGGSVDLGELPTGIATANVYNVVDGELAGQVADLTDLAPGDYTIIATAVSNYRILAENGWTLSVSGKAVFSFTIDEVDCPVTVVEEPDETVSEWEFSTFDCETRTITETRTVTTTPHIVVNNENVLDTENATSVTETQTRLMSEDELDEFCPIAEEPDATVVAGDWVIGSYECGDVTVEETRTVTTTPFVLVDREWVAGESVETTETQTRSLTDAEIAALECAEEPDFEFPTFPLVEPFASATQPTCDVAGGYTLNDTDGVAWFVDGVEKAPGTYQADAGTSVSVEAVAETGFGFAEESQTEWTFEFTAPSGCEEEPSTEELPTLALTGVTGLAGTAALVALLITLTGVGMVAARRRVEV